MHKLTAVPGRVWLIVALVLAFGIAAHQQTSAQEEARISIDQVIVDGQREDSVTVLVSVLNGEAMPIPGIDGFEASVDGAAVEVQSTEPVVNNEAGVAVLMLIDVSGSMSGAPIAEARRAAATFIQQLPPQDMVAVVPFGSRVPSGASFTANQAELLAAVGSLEAEPNLGTALYDSLVASFQLAAGAPIPRRAMILLTDGQDSAANGNRTRVEALAAAANAGLPIFAIGLGEDADVDLLAALTREAQGAFYQAPAPADIAAIFDAIGATLRGQYAITLQLPRSERAERELVVQLDHAGTTLSARTVFVAEANIEGVGSESSGASVLLVGVVGAVAVLGVFAAVFFFVRQRRRRRTVLEGGPPGSLDVSYRPSQAARGGHVSGYLTIVEGPQAGTSVRLTAGTMEIGTDPECGLRLAGPGGAVASRHARVWLQGGRLMVHHVGRRRQTLVDGKAIEWATLEPSETFRIGPCGIAFNIETPHDFPIFNRVPVPGSPDHRSGAPAC